MNREKLAGIAVFYNIQSLDGAHFGGNVICARNRNGFRIQQQMQWIFRHHEISLIVLLTVIRIYSSDVFEVRLQ